MKKEMIWCEHMFYDEGVKSYFLDWDYDAIYDEDEFKFCPLCGKKRPVEANKTK